VSGTVIYFIPGASVFLQDGDHGMEIQTKARSPLAIGDRAEVLGFVSQGAYTPLLQDAVYRKITNGPPPPPAQLTTDEALKGNHDCQLIQVSARLVDRTQHGSEQFPAGEQSHFPSQPRHDQWPPRLRPAAKRQPGDGHGRLPH
jgi:hypothetical protein